MSTVMSQRKQAKGMSPTIQSRYKKNNSPKILRLSSNFFLQPEQRMLKMLHKIKTRPASNLNQSLSSSSQTKSQTSQAH